MEEVLCYNTAFSGMVWGRDLKVAVEGLVS